MVEARGKLRSSKLQLSSLRKMREVEQVAAICYRVRGGEIEFLLVQTRGSGRWTFPKGGAEAGLTHAQAAAIEAFEEAGVHGRIEEAAFARYEGRKSGGRRSGDRRAVSAHLCEVQRLGPPKEAGRNRTWFSAREAQVKLRDGRKIEEGKEFARVIEKAVDRIRRLAREDGFVCNRPVTFANHEWNRVEIELHRPAGGWAVESLPVRSRGSVAIQSIEFADDPESEAIPDSLPHTGGGSELLSGSRKFKALGAGNRVQ